MAIVEISGYKVLLDDELAADIDPTLWECRETHGRPYFRTVCRCGGVRKTAWLHHIACVRPKGKQVDHQNMDTLDNRRQNLRACTPAENIRNRGIFKCNKSGFKGVSFAKWMPLRPWHAQIAYQGKRKHLGFFVTKEEAALAYNQAAICWHGEFANLNKLEV